MVVDEHAGFCALTVIDLYNIKWMRFGSYDWVNNRESCKKPRQQHRQPHHGHLGERNEMNLM